MGKARRRRASLPYAIRLMVLARDGYRCYICGVRVTVKKFDRYDEKDPLRASVDHAVSRADGGTDCYTNLGTTCRGCNEWKGPRSVDTVFPDIPEAPPPDPRRRPLPVLRMLPLVVVVHPDIWLVITHRRKPIIRRIP